MKGPEVKKPTFAGILYPKKGEELENYIQYLVSSIRVDALNSQDIKALILP
jgi:predicted class III extradiol MEMO1 family dioxygenase